jgi:hypothetical protein
MGDQDFSDTYDNIARERVDRGRREDDSNTEVRSNAKTRPSNVRSITDLARGLAPPDEPATAPASALKSLQPTSLDKARHEAHKRAHHHANADDAVTAMQNVRRAVYDSTWTQSRWHGVAKDEITTSAHGPAYDRGGARRAAKLGERANDPRLVHDTFQQKTIVNTNGTFWERMRHMLLGSNISSVQATRDMTYHQTYSNGE